MTSKTALLAEQDAQLLSPLGFRNLIINGNFDFWQRATSQTAIGYGSADRWKTHYNGSATLAFSRQDFVPGQADVPNDPRYFGRCTVVAGASTNDTAYIAHSIEGAHHFAGRDIIISFWAKADAPKNVSISIRQHYGMGAAPTFLATKIAITTTWQRYVFRAVMPSISGLPTSIFDGRIAVLFYFSAGTAFDSMTDTLGHQAGVFDIAQVQFAGGAVDIPFEKRSFADELRLCQRYCEKTYNFNVDPGTLTNAGALVQKQRVAAGSVDVFTWDFAVPKATNAVALTLHNPNNVAAVARNVTTNANCATAAEAIYSGQRGAAIPFTTAAGSSVGNTNLIHAIASAEIG